MSREPEDRSERSKIKNQTGETLFVEAGAGSGKTAALVGRVANLVLTDRVPIDQIAAVTFTERAAAELRQRLRERLEATPSDEERKNAAPDRDELAARAVEGLDLAAIGTLHSFAQRILSEHPIEAGIPPMIEVLDEVTSSVERETRWTRVRRELLEDPAMSEVVGLFDATNVTLEHVKSIIVKLTSDWDLVADRITGTEVSPVTVPSIEPFLARARELAAFAELCLDPVDSVYQGLAKVDAWVRAVEQIDWQDGSAVVGALREVESIKWGAGAKGRWPGIDHHALKDDCKVWQSQMKQARTEVTDAVLRSVVRWCADRVLQDAERRRAEGRLEFHDLLVLARDLLRDNAEVRAALQARYPRLLLDEFQDTDPIQIEIAMRIAGGADADQGDWTGIEVPPGSLFVVGDPKQSIYRFRRADIEMYLTAQGELGGETSLSTNFRTGEPIIEWVNEVFGELIVFADGKQPAYQRLLPWRSAPTVGPAVMVLGTEEHPAESNAADLRTYEARDVAASIATALSEEWTTGEQRITDGAPAKDDDGNPIEDWRPLRPGDITILVPARTSLPYLEDALDAAGIGYRTESSSLVYHGDEIRALLAACRALADPSDDFALLTALRSPLFGLSDATLWDWRNRGGRFRLRGAAPDGLGDHPVAQAVDYLSRLQRDSRWLTPSEVLTRLVVDRRVLEAAAFSPRTRDAWRRVRFVVDQARAWSEAEHGGLRAYVDWATAQSQETARVSESVLPESDVDSVRIMTVHAAKGLEFPMVVLSGMTAKPTNRHGVSILWRPDGYAVKLSRDVATGDFNDLLPVEEQMSGFERTRLLYVAATRARDHLVVSLHRSASGHNKGTAAHELAGAVAAMSSGGAVPLGRQDAEGLKAPAARRVTPPPEWQRWRDELEEIARRSAIAASRSASGLEGTEPEVLQERTAEGEPLPGAAKGARDLAAPAWAKGRYGSAIGRAVHAVLQAVPLTAGADDADPAVLAQVDDAVAAQCVAEGVTEFAELVGAMVRSALRSDVVQRAAAREHWRECYVGMRTDDGDVLEGIVDLIYREDDGSLVVVDYKTDTVPDAALPTRTAYYRPQVRAYRDLVRTATGSDVGAPVLVFARESAAAAEVQVPQ